MFKLTPARRVNNGYVRPKDFDDFFEDFLPTFFGPAREQERQWNPAVEVSEKEGALEFQVEHIPVKGNALREGIHGDPDVVDLINHSPFRSFSMASSFVLIR